MNVYHYCGYKKKEKRWSNREIPKKELKDPQAQVTLLKVIAAIFKIVKKV